MLTLNQNHHNNGSSSDIESQNKDNGEKEYEKILKKNPTYKKTYDNTGYLYIGDVTLEGRKYYGLQKEDEKENLKNKLFDRFKEKNILIPENKNFKILNNKGSILNFLKNIKQNYKINNFHFYLDLHGNKKRERCATFEYIDNDGKNKYFNMTSGDVGTLLQSIKEVFKDDNLYICNKSPLL